MTPLYHQVFIHPTISIGIAKIAFGNTNASFEWFLLAALHLYLLEDVACLEQLQPNSREEVTELLYLFH